MDRVRHSLIRLGKEPQREGGSNGECSVVGLHLLLNLKKKKHTLMSNVAPGRSR